MFQRPPKRRTLGSVNSNSTYVNHQHMPSPSSPVDVGYGSDSISNGHYSRRNDRRRKKGGIPCGFFLFWTTLLLAGPYLYYEYYVMPNLVLSEGSPEEVERIKHHWMTKYHKLQKQHEALEKDLKTKAEQLQQAVELGGGGAQEEALKRKLSETNDVLRQERVWFQEWKTKAENLERSEKDFRAVIKEISKRTLIQKYGPGPYQVEFELSFGEGEGSSAWITIELAPADEMPHTVYTFLEQVTRGLYNDGGYSFHHNAVHVVQGGPIPNHLTPVGVDPNERFQESGVASVLFQEYSESMPHVQYTVGMSGRPSGPNFYFNVQDNSKLHGPGGYAKDGSADPCFGRVIRGQDAIDAMHQLGGGVNPGEWKELNPLVAVRWVKLLN